MRAILSVRRAQVGEAAPQPAMGAVSTAGALGWLARQEGDCQGADRLAAIADADDELTTEQLEVEINNLQI